MTAARDRKDERLDQHRVDDTGQPLTTAQGVRIGHTDDALTAGERGPTLLEDFHAREKLTHFDHERIPERVVHARGSGAYGEFRAYDDALADVTVARFLTDPSLTTPVFVRFSTVAGSRGSADTVRDVRGFATKFYTAQGNYDLVGNNMPVFFIQDGIKFPDFVHAVKPEPNNEMPQAASAHDTLWDFVGQQPETLHTIMWLMSDRAIPRSYRMMQGFGVHTFRLVNAEGQGTFVKFHWRPKLGTHSLVWDEAQKIAGKDPDFNRRDLWEAIEAGDYPEFELSVQLVPEEREHDFDVDLLDATKLIPEEEVPLRPVGRMVLNRNPDNFFAETEQVAFHTANVVPGIDFTNDPLLQARNFSYLDTQLIRLGGPNFTHIPVNRPVAEVHTNQRGGYQQHQVHTGQTSYAPNTLGAGCPAASGQFPDVYAHYQEKVEGAKVRRRSESFQDFYSQATLFWNSMTPAEKDHIVAAFRFELGKVNAMPVRVTAVAQLNEVDHDLAAQVAAGIGVPEPGRPSRANHGRSSGALSQLPGQAQDARADTIETRRVAVLVADGMDGVGTSRLAEALRKRGAVVELLAPHDGTVDSADTEPVDVDRALPTMASVLYDAVLVPCGPDSTAALARDGYAVHFVAEAYKHGKPVAAFGTGRRVLTRAGVLAERDAEADVEVSADHGLVVSSLAKDDVPDRFTEELAAALSRHRDYDRTVDHISA